MSNKGNSSLYEKKDNACLFQIIDDTIETFSSLLQEKNEESHSSVCSLWVDAPQPAKKPSGFDTEFWEDGSLTDLTLLVGPEKVRMKVHRVVLAAHFEYFKSVFSGRLKAGLTLILKYAYNEEPNLSKENVLRMADMARE